MTSPMYTNSVPVFKQLLTALKTILATTSAEVAAKSMSPDAFLQARLYPDMFPLVKQVQIACDFARGISARLAGVDVPVHEGNETSFADLDALLTSGQAYLSNYGLPQFFFHVTTTYAILRHNGVAIGKKDYMGAY